ncbi:MAG: ribosome biogenesis GTPase Der [Cycloclasticus sp. symbiont of Poecilosclerida sp. M]|nr:MAG: ribosome biogenesis GTPase Der [Cycloclasticus sp. symbiont of Poecilosclerida sp. M]
MLPVIALVGRPNVGKSTLFNYLTKTRDALVADYPGLTRDRQYGLIKRGGVRGLVVDTSGISATADGIDGVAVEQAQRALEEADVVLFMMDTRHGLHPIDEEIANSLRKLSKTVVLVANKIDGLDANTHIAEFHGMGFEKPWPIAATHGRGVTELLKYVVGLLPEAEFSSESLPGEGIRVAVIGRPNVGKSTLINRVLGEERVVVFDEPGTTRDSVFIPFERSGKKYTLIDTAGVRRRSKVSEVVEKFSIVQTLRAIDDTHVVIYLIDTSEGVTDQDASLLGMVLESGRALVIGLNKWDGLSEDQRDKVKRQVDVKLGFLEYAERYYISALHGSGVGKLFDAIDALYHSAMIDMSTPRLTEILKNGIQTHQPPLVKGRRIKLKYAHQGGQNPPVVVIHGNQTVAIPGSYKRYLMNLFRDKLGLVGTPIRLEFKSPDNPYTKKTRKSATNIAKGKAGKSLEKKPRKKIKHR